jgi:hypothetical protein
VCRSDRREEETEWREEETEWRETLSTIEIPHSKSVGINLANAAMLQRGERSSTDGRHTDGYDEQANKR